MRRRFFALRLVLLISAGLIALAFLVWLGVYLSARRTVWREFAKIRAKGEPTTLAELAPPPVPEEENAAVLLEKAFAKIEARWAEEPEGWIYSLLTGPEPDFEKFAEAVAAQAEAIDLTREALERPRCRFTLDYSAGPAMELRHLTALRDLAHLFAAEALLRSHQGKAAEAAESLVHTFDLVRATDEEPIFISKLISMVVLSIGIKALKKIERATLLPDDARRKLISRLGRLDLHRAATHALTWERILTCCAFGRARGGERISMIPAWYGRWGLVYVRDEAKLLPIATWMVDASRLASWEALPKMEPLYRQQSDVVAKHTCLTLDGGHNAYASFVKGMALRDAVRLGLACELCRSARGKWPDKLQDMVPDFLPDVPPDPFSEKPFVYRRKGGRLIVYSLGENLKDDGGRSDRASGADDISWESAPGGPAPSLAPGPPAP